MSSSEVKTPPEGEEPPGLDAATLRWLKWLVASLTAVMIGGVIAIVALLWLSYSNARAPLPDVIALPDGSSATAFTQGADWFAVVTADDRILIFDRASGTLRQTVVITD